MGQWVELPIEWEQLEWVATRQLVELAVAPSTNFSIASFGVPDHRQRRTSSGMDG